MKLKGLWLVCVSLIINICLGQSDTLESMTRQFYATLNQGDSTAIKAYFHEGAFISHLGKDDSFTLTLSQFMTVAPKFKNDHFSEEISCVTITSFTSGLSYVDVYFDFYIDGSYVHSGIDHICYSYRKGKLKIESVYSSEFETKQTEVIPLDTLMNNWHSYAAKANFDGYFGFMNDNFIYLGTDPGERWTKETFAGFSRPYFDKGKGWDFKTNWRNWYFSADKKTAWFEESLDTWMEECRGSGVLVLENGEWKIAHYNLTVLIENGKIEEFIELRQK